VGSRVSKKVKVLEHKKKYKELILQELFSDDELTASIRRDRAAFYNKKSFAEMDVLTQKVNLLKKTSLNGL
jgi:hypothetical protein